MLKFISLSLALTAFSAGVTYPSISLSKESLNNRREQIWFCTANGYDHQNLRSISGNNEKSELLAEKSALKKCESLGFTGCLIGSCFQEN
jgi:hypothetical protein